MKKMAYAGLAAAALALTALSGQRAGAQCCPPVQRGGEISFNVGVTLGCHWSHSPGHWVSDCPPPCYGPPPYGYPPPGYAPYGQPPAAAQSAPVAPKDTKEPKEQAAAAGVQNIGYSYPAAYGYGYDYTYGYPYYQAPAYWYGR